MRESNPNRHFYIAEIHFPKRKTVKNGYFFGFFTFPCTHADSPVLIGTHVYSPVLSGTFYCFYALYFVIKQVFVRKMRHNSIRVKRYGTSKREVHFYEEHRHFRILSFFAHRNNTFCVSRHKERKGNRVFGRKKCMRRDW